MRAAVATERRRKEKKKSNGSRNSLRKDYFMPLSSGEFQDLELFRLK
jgi:hypothetical protein